MVQDPIQSEELIWLVVMEIGFGQVLAIQRFVPVELDDLFDQRVVVAKIAVIEKALRVELPLDQWIAPVNRQAPRRYGLDDFFGGVSRKRRVLERDVELVSLQEFDLAPRSPRHLVPDVVERPAAGIHLLVTAEAVKKVVPLAGGSRAPGVAGDEGAEVGLCLHDSVDVTVFSQ